ncbi:MAG: phosphatidate cytidylyltransferase [Chitinophagaceae bacterium]|nr:phosphatidate cytidylyltransferase [Chitinophagaceae bacterium]
MAFNLQTFRTRTLTAVFFVLVMLAGLLLNQWSFFILFTIIHFGCWREYQKLIGLIHQSYNDITPFHRYGVMLAGWSIMLYFASDAIRIGSLTFSSVGWWLGLVFVFGLPIVEILFSRQLNLKNIGYSALGLLYISLSCGLMLNIRSGELWMPGENNESIFKGLSGVLASLTGYVVPLIIIASMWINDTMAYIVGSLIGKTPFWPSISPKKTWEGTVGGIVLCVVTVTLIGVYLIKGQALPFMAISLTASLAGTGGDLLESKIKRLAGVKDSGSVMPGHGGFLDRFDSLLVAVPFVWLLIVVFKIV